MSNKALEYYQIIQKINNNGPFHNLNQKQLLSWLTNLFVQTLLRNKNKKDALKKEEEEEGKKFFFIRYCKII